MADIDFSLLDVPRDAPPADPEAYLRTAIAWHFGADTGSPFWLRAARDSGLRSADRRADLRRPAPVSQPGRRTAQRPRRRPHPPRLRLTRADPAASSNRAAPPARRNAPRSFPTGSSRSPAGRSRISPRAVSCRVAGWLCLMPSGPHGVGHFDRVVAERLGSVFHPIDLGSAVGQEARRTQRDGGDGRLRGPRAGAGEVHPGDAGRRKPARDTAVGRGDRSRRRVWSTW